MSSSFRSLLKLSFYTLVFALLSIGSVSGTAMSGTYTVCNSACSYSTINGALSALKSNGVSGPVIISIASGKWNETLSITSSITGVSSKNTVTFSGAGTFSTIITSSSTVISISSSTYITFKHLEVDMTSSSSGYAVSLSSGANYINFIRCNIITGGSSGTYTYGLEPVYISGADYCDFDTFSISGSGYACVQNFSSTGVQFNYCRVTNYYYFAFYNDNTYNAVYNGNYIDSGGYYGLYSIEENGAEVENNIIPCTAANLCYYGMYLDYPNGSSASSPFIVVNNIVGPNFYEAGIYIYTSSISNAGVYIYQNTINGNALAATYYYFADLVVYLGSTSASGYDIRNNELSLAGGGGYCLSLYDGATGITGENGNNLYNPGGELVYFSGAGYTDLPSYQSAVASSGFAANDLNQQPIFVSATNFRYAKNVPEPYGPYCGVPTDIDGNVRCKVFPSVGASESNFGKSNNASTATVYGPDTAFVGSPALFTNSSAPGSPIAYTWYIDGVFAGSSNTLTTSSLKAPGDSIKLIEKGCGGTFSNTKWVVVDTPSKVPISSFISNLNVIQQNQTVSFYDLSNNGPSKWSWTITPDSVYDPNLAAKVNAYIYTTGSSASQNPQVQFLYSGQYDVCLTASNARGTGNNECKKSYITVIPAIDMCNQSIINDKSGYLYDDGGPTGNLGNNVNCSTLINPCADTAYFVFDIFDMDCGYAYLQLLDGVGGNPLNSKHSQRQSAAGFTGGNGACSTSDLPAIGDTFVSTTGQIFVYEITSNPVTSGFAAHWWGHSKAFSTPVAKIKSVMPSNDSICFNGTMTFYADSAASPGSTFLWDVDGDTTNGFEAGGTSVTWPYFQTGTYTIRLVASNCGGSDTARVTITVFTASAPIATFKADNTTPATNDIVFFSPTEMMCVDDYRWTFTGPNGSSSLYTFINGTNRYSEYPQVTFTDTGCWTVTLYEDNNGGLDSDTKTINCYIYVKGTYCTPSITTPVQDIGFSDVSINNISNKTTANRLGYNNYLPVYSTTLEAGLKYTLNLARASNYNSVDISVWVDWNGDKSFTDSGDLIFHTFKDPGTNWTVSGIQVPPSAKLGATVMRIAINKGGLGDKICGQDAYGDYEDYRLYITPYITAPVITLTGGDTVYFNEGQSYVDPGYTAISALYGDISLAVKGTWKGNNAYQKLVPGTYIRYYNVTDASGNKAKQVERVIIVLPDVLPPNLIVGCTGNPDTLFIEVYPGTQFQDPGICSSFDLVDGDVSDSVTELGSVNTNIVGKYTLSYTSCDYSGNCITKTRTVFVIDTLAPVITLIGSGNPVISNINTPYVDSGATITDNYWLNTPLIDSTNINIHVPGIYYYTYYATDSSGNKAVPVTRYVVVKDNQPPMLTLIGPANVTMEVNTTYKDPGATGKDNVDKTVNIIQGGTFFKSFPGGTPVRLGKYTITYSATDSAGNNTTLIRNITVVDDIAPVISLKGLPAVTTCRWIPYTDAGYNVTDNYSLLKGPNHVTVTTLSNVDVATPGVYYVYYRASDSVGNTDSSSVRVVYVTDEGGCTASSGINNGKSLGDYISIYPNPSSGEFVIDLNLPKQENVLITVTNVMGEIIKQTYDGLGTGKQVIDLSTAASGIYFVNIATNNETITRKVTITK